MRTRISVSPFVILSALVFGLSCNCLAEGKEWKNLFDGKSLKGWMVKCRPQDNDKYYWKVDRGTITAEVPQGSTHHYIWLLTEAEYDDFELRLRIQSYAASTGNSGIQVRSRYDDEAGWLDGPQVDINPPGAWRCGFIYDETREVKQWISPITGPPSKAKPSDAPKEWKWFHADQGNGWNDVRIVCKGTRIKTIVNGPFTFTPDGNPLVGSVPGLRNYWTACGVMAGLSPSVPCGLWHVVQSRNPCTASSNASELSK